MFLADISGFSPDGRGKLSTLAVCLAHCSSYEILLLFSHHTCHPAPFIMTDLSGLHGTATRLILALRDGLERLEAAEVWLPNLEHPLGVNHLVMHSFLTSVIWRTEWYTTGRSIRNGAGFAAEAEGIAGGWPGLHGAQFRFTPRIR